MSEVQSLQPNTWTPMLGTDTEVLIDGLPAGIDVRAERYRDRNGHELLQFSWTMPSGEKIAIRAPGVAPDWTEDFPPG
ncbi:hypothetical protein [Actinomadura sp. 21ATH]|uniref:hypothetical protein n=1 Tax=Actinomadura sp. 21ATH TaxID=1735444 RepID=UPI0035C14427